MRQADHRRGYECGSRAGLSWQTYGADSRQADTSCRRVRGRRRQSKGTRTTWQWRSDLPCVGRHWKACDPRQASADACHGVRYTTGGKASRTCGLCGCTGGGASDAPNR